MKRRGPRFMVEAFVMVLVFHTTLSRYEKPHRPCFFNALCSCSSTSPDLGSVVCQNVPLITVPRELRLSAVYIIHFERNDLKNVDENSFNGTGLWKLQINSNHLTNLPPKSLAGLEKTLSILDLSDNKIVRVPRYALSKMQKLQTLKLSKNRISSVHPDDIFQIGKSLKNLDLSENSLSHIHNDALRNMESLETLNLAKNSLITVNDVFLQNGFHNLKFINLMENQLRQVPFTALVHMSRIRVVNLSGNLISSLPNDSGIQRRIILEELNLENNLVNKLPTKSFFFFFSIDKIFLKGNNLRVVNDSAFFGMNSVEINLSDCGLSDITFDAFKDLENSLQFLDLSFNNLINFPSMRFNKLESLNLRGNKIKSLSLELLENFGNTIKYLDVSGNEMGPFTEDIFDKLIRLRSISFKKAGNGRLSKEDFRKGKQTLENLQLVFNSIHSIENGAFSHFSSLKVLDLSHNNVRTIEKDSFKNLAHSLEELVIHNALSMTQFPADAFKHLSELLYLDLSSNALTSLPQNSCAYLERLQHINLNFNEIKEIGPWFINRRNNPEIRTIKLAFNRITTLEASTFNNLKKLSTVDLSDNLVKEIKSSAFIDLDSITFINLEANCITEIENEAFQNLPSVQIINFSRNKLKSFNLDAFDQVGRLSALKVDVRYNLIQELTRNSTSSYQSSNIREITFRHNNISSVDSKYFDAIRHSIVSLDLSENIIRNISDDILHSMQHLQVLNMASNEILEISELLLEGLENLQMLNLSFNRISNLPPNLFKDNRNLRILDVSSNKLKVFHNSLQPTALEKLHLSDNLLEDFPEDSLINVNETLQYLDVSKNRIRLLNMSSLERLRNIKYLILSTNDLLYLPDFLRLNLSDLVTLDVSSNTWMDTDEANISLSILSTSIENLNLANTKLKFIPNLQSPTLMLLNVSHNYIQTISPEFLENLRNLQEIDLSNNLIKDIHKNAWINIRNMHSLRLNNNPVRDLNKYSFTNLKMLRQLSIGNLQLNSIDSSIFSPLVSLQKLEIDFIPGMWGEIFGKMLRDNDGIKELVLHVRGGRLSHVFNEDAPKSLTTIVIQGNEVKEIDKEAFSRISSKNVVFEIRQTNITHLSGEIFENMKAVRNVSVVLEKNMLQSVGRLTAKHSTEASIRRLLKLKLGGNRIFCDCALDWMWEWLSEYEYEHNCRERAFCYKDVLEGMRKTECYNKQNISVVDAFKTDLFCLKNTSANQSVFFLFIGVIQMLVNLYWVSGCVS